MKKYALILAITLAPCTISLHAADSWGDVLRNAPKKGVEKGIENAISKKVEAIYNKVIIERLERWFGIKTGSDSEKIKDLAERINLLRKTKGADKKHINKLIRELNDLLEKQNKDDKK